MQCRSLLLAAGRQPVVIDPNARASESRTFSTEFADRSQSDPRVNIARILGVSPGVMPILCVASSVPESGQIGSFAEIRTPRRDEWLSPERERIPKGSIARRTPPHSCPIPIRSAVRAQLSVGGRQYTYFHLAPLDGIEGSVSKTLPFSLRVLLENLVRGEDGAFVKPWGR